jgi:hypothetical protein
MRRKKLPGGSPWRKRRSARDQQPHPPHDAQLPDHLQLERHHIQAFDAQHFQVLPAFQLHSAPGFSEQLPQEQLPLQTWCPQQDVVDP